MKHLTYNNNIYHLFLKILLTLKALGNMGVAGKSASTLARCAGNNEIPTEIRLAAMDAFRRMPCEQSVSLYCFSDNHEKNLNYLHT